VGAFISSINQQHFSLEEQSLSNVFQKPKTTGILPKPHLKLTDLLKQVLNKIQGATQWITKPPA
jgi:hypothetical protein